MGQMLLTRRSKAAAFKAKLHQSEMLGSKETKHLNHATQRSGKGNNIWKKKAKNRIQLSQTAVVNNPGPLPQQPVSSRPHPSEDRRPGRRPACTWSLVLEVVLQSLRQRQRLDVVDALSAQGQAGRPPAQVHQGEGLR